MAQIPGQVDRPALTPEELDRLRTILEAEKAKSVTAPYTEQATKFNTQADTLDKQAETPYPTPQTTSQRIVAGLRNGMESFGRLGAPGGTETQEALRRKQFDEENTTRITRAKSLRDNAEKQQKLGADAADLNQRTNYETGSLAARGQEIDIQKQTEARLAKEANRPKQVTTTYGGITQSYGADGLPIEGSRTDGNAKPTTPKDPKFMDRVEKNGHTMRDYFEWKIDDTTGEPVRTLLSSEDRGIQPATTAAQNSSKSVVDFTPEGSVTAVKGIANKNSGTIAPMSLAGDATKAPVPNATLGNKQAGAVTKSTVDLAGGERLLKSMQDTLARIESGKSSAVGADDMSLLSNHIAMTFGLVKGARMGKDLIVAHENAIATDARLKRAVDTVLNGGQLDPGQRREFVELAKRRVEEMRGERQGLEDYFTGSSAPAAPAAGGTAVIPGGALDKLINGQRGGR